ncbi:sugar diacid utilization regulator SdaR [Photobacterium aphoticum]|uniref:Sugar diacid utilization regulator SdaR n=1 Tax=Photobacterium aphoticum TaxID=754436 RepID=A0A090QUG8_9GAMM|nr:sugar diacid utilization regulator SdaR [Photobacterium aphoticum]
MSQVQWNKRHREELVLQLIKGTELNEAQLLSIAQKLDLDLAQPRIATIVKVIPSAGEALSLEHLQRMCICWNFRNATTWWALCPSR